MAEPTPPAPTATLPTRAARLDRLPFGPQHTKLLLGSGIGWALDAMDVGLISYVMAALAAQWSLTPTELSWLGSIGFLGMMIGASVGGLLADKIGRRNVFALTLLTYGLATGASAFSTGLAALLLLRFIVGLGLGAELPVASTLVAEFSPRAIRGRVVVALESFWALGWIMAALLGFFLVPTTHAGWPGWRWALLVGVAPALYAIVVRRGLPESVRFLEKVGKIAQAEASVRAFERGGAHAPAVSVSEAVAATPMSVTPAATGPSILSRPLRTRTLALWAVWFFVNLAYYGAFTWMPTLLYLQGHSLVRSFGFTLIMTLAQLPGYAVAAWLIETWGRRATLASFLVGSGIAAGLFAAQTTPAGIIAAGCALSFFNLGAWGALYAIGPEIYPTGVRGTGTGAAAAVGRIAGVLAPLAVPALLAAGSLGLVFATFAVSFALAAAAALVLPDRRDLDMVEELEPTRPQP